MNDATELETSFAGAINFFQNLHRKLGALEIDIATRHESLSNVAASLGAFQQVQQGDRQALATLTSQCEMQLQQLTQVRAEIELLQQHWRQLETLSSTLAEDQQARKALAAALQADLQIQAAALREALEAKLVTDLTQRNPALARIEVIEDRLGGFGETLQQHEQRQDLLQAALATNQTTDLQLQAQRDQLEQLAQSSTNLDEGLQAAQRNLSNLSSEFDDQRQLTQTELNQARQELQTHHDRFKYLETLVTKLSSDTHSTRQILNVLQSDLGVQSDTLRDLDQTWREGLAHYQERLSGLEQTLAQPLAAPTTLTPTPTVIATLDDESPFLTTSSEESPFLVDPSEGVSETASATPINLLEDQPATLQTAAVTALQEALATHGLMLDQLQQSLEQKLILQNQRLEDLEARIDTQSNQPAPALQADLEPLHAALAEHTGLFAEWREYTQQRWTTLNTTFADQGEALQTLLAQFTELQQQVAQNQQQASVDLATTQPADLAEPAHADTTQQNLELLQEAVAGLETRLTGQAQAFSSNFEQFQGLNTAIQELQQQVGKLDSSRRLNMIEKVIAAQEQTIAQLSVDLQQTKEETQHIIETTQNQSPNSKLEDMAAQLDQQREQLTGLSATVDTIRGDSKATQEKILTMAANVAQRLHEFQHQLIAAKTTQGEQLQAVEQKLIALQAAVETMEMQRKPKRWFSMPASLTTVVLAIGATLFAILTRFS
jgi:chromosome segregation ATPase